MGSVVDKRAGQSAAGWFSDPWRIAQWRYWDGVERTGWTASQPSPTHRAAPSPWTTRNAAICSGLAIASMVLPTLGHLGTLEDAWGELSWLGPLVAAVLALIGMVLGAISPTSPGGRGAGIVAMWANIAVFHAVPVKFLFMWSVALTESGG